MSDSYTVVCLSCEMDCLPIKRSAGGWFVPDAEAWAALLTEHEYHVHELRIIHEGGITSALEAWR